MISRRQLCLQMGAATALASTPLKKLSSGLTASVDANGVSLHYQNGSWDLKADHVQVGGIPVPSTDWGWIGLTVASGVLSSVGGLIVNLIVGLLTKNNEPNIADLMRQQLEAFTKIVVEVARQSLVVQAKGALASDIQLLQEYQINPKGAGARLDHLITSTSSTLGLLGQLDYAGYPTFMQLSGLRLAILQDRIAIEGKPAAIVFNNQRNTSIAFHKSIDAFIDKQTEPATHFPATVPLPLLLQLTQTVTVFGKTASGKIKYSEHPAVQRPGSLPWSEWRLDSVDNVSASIAQGHSDLLDWAALRKQIKAESTTLGEAMIKEWMQAPAGLSPSRRGIVRENLM